MTLGMTPWGWQAPRWGGSQRERALPSSVPDSRPGSAPKLVETVSAGVSTSLSGKGG